MTQQEFTQRTMVEVSNNEFWAINEVYNNSDLNKDEFCKMWCKMNKSRVELAKMELKRRQKHNLYKHILTKWYDGWKARADFQDNYYTLIVYTKLPTAFVPALSHFDIRIGNAETVSDVHYKVGKALGFIA